MLNIMSLLMKILRINDMLIKVKFILFMKELNGIVKIRINCFIAIGLKWICLMRISRIRLLIDIMPGICYNEIIVYLFFIIIT